MQHTSRGYRYPGELDPADIAPYFQNLATDISNDVDKIAPMVEQFQRTGTGVAVPDSAFTTVGFNLTTIGAGLFPYTGGVATANFNGVVEASLTVIWPAIAAAHRTIQRITVNGGQTLDGLDTKWVAAGTTGQTGHTVRSVFRVSVGDGISGQVFQDSGASVTTVSDSAVLTLRRIA